MRGGKCRCGCGHMISVQKNVTKRLKKQKSSLFWQIKSAKREKPKLQKVHKINEIYVQSGTMSFSPVKPYVRLTPFLITFLGLDWKINVPYPPL